MYGSSSKQYEPKTARAEQYEQTVSTAATDTKTTTPAACHLLYNRAVE